ncbi:MAG: hypothetical protein P4L40_25015 [Terracidiphilus sp.]|nr:hypothetical protein [Terracidiphilus sp.]
MQGKKSVKKVVRSAAGPEPAALSLDSARAAIGSAEAALAAVRDAETGLVRRAGASAGNTRALVANMQDGLDAVAREASSDAVHVASGWCKAWEALAECEDVSAEQLCAHADGIEGAISAGDAAVVAKWHEAATLALACLARSHPPVSSWADVTVSPYAECAIGFSLWCRSRAAECVVSGPGADGFVLGDGDAINTVLLRLLDECGDGIDDVAPTDIAVSVSGGTVVGASTLESGVVEVCYSVPETRLHPVVLCVDPVAWALPMTRRSVNVSNCVFVGISVSSMCSGTPPPHPRLP